MEKPSRGPRNRFIIDPGFPVRGGDLTVPDHGESGWGTHDGDHCWEDNQKRAGVIEVDAFERGYP